MAAKLYYFEGKRGDAEAIRMLFADAQLPYENVGVSQAQFDEMVKSGDLLFGQLPMLEIGSMKLVEPAAILEHIASMADARGGSNLYLGATENERSTARSLCSAAAEVRRELLLVRQSKHNAAIRNNFKDNILPAFFTSVDKLAVASSEQDKGLGDGVHFTFGDMAVFEVVNAVCEEFKVGILRPYPNMKEWHDKARYRPEVDKYIVARAEAEW